MQLCTDCLHLDDRKAEHCPSCGGSDFAHATKKGDVVAVPAAAGMPCQHCYEVDHDLKLRYYRRVLALIFWARIWGDVGYFCAPCRAKRFGANMGFTLLLGWWGFFAFCFYNPYAILANLWALFAPPFGAGSFGAMNVNEIRAEAVEHAEGQQRLADVYMRMPGWLESLKEEEIDLILSDADYYSVLAVAGDATHLEIKAAFREQVKLHHPDTAGAASHEQMVVINDAYRVLGDERLRHAYDNRDELLAFLRDVSDAEGAPEDDDFLYGCEPCGIGFYSFDDAAEHCGEVHPHVDPGEVLVRFFDIDDEADDDSAPADVGEWRCKTCSQVFLAHEDALAHAERAHPERDVVDIRRAVERV